MVGQGSDRGEDAWGRKNSRVWLQTGGTLEEGLQGSGDLVTGMGWGEVEERAQ